jgi:hypothetical protein
MSKKSIVLILMAAVSTSAAHIVSAESSAYSMPPPGPYRSVGDVDQYNLNQNGQTDLQLSREKPEWVKQHQIQMEQQMNRPMPPAQVWTNQPAQRNYNQVHPMMNAGAYPDQHSNARLNPYMGAYPSSGMVPNSQVNRMHQYPYARQPVYAPMPPPEYYRQPAYPAPGY